MCYYNNEEAKVNLMHALVKAGWKVYGYKPDQSDSMTDYFSPARWDGIAEKNGFILVVDNKSTSYSGYKKVERNYKQSAVNYDRIRKLEALRDDAGATEGEKQAAQFQIDRIMQKLEDQPEKVIEQYPTFTHGNPGKCNWHIEKDGVIIDKGMGIFQCYQSNAWEGNEAHKKQTEIINKFVSRFENAIQSAEQLEAVEVKEVVKVVKPVDVETIAPEQFVLNQTVIKLNHSFTGGHYKGELLVFVERCKFTGNYIFVKLGKKYKPLKRYGAANNSLSLRAENFKKWLNDGTISLVEIKEVEEVTTKIVYKKVERKQQPNYDIPALEGEVTEQPEQTKKEVKQNENKSGEQATKKQLWALHLASGRTIDTRNINITKQQASDLIGRSKAGEDITKELRIIAGLEVKEEKQEAQQPEDMATTIQEQTQEQSEQTSTPEEIAEQIADVVTDYLINTFDKPAHKLTENERLQYTQFMQNEIVKYSVTDEVMQILKNQYPSIVEVLETDLQYKFIVDTSYKYHDVHFKA